MFYVFWYTILNFLQNLSTELLQTIAAEINLTETAFLEHESDDSTFDTSKSSHILDHSDSGSWKYPVPPTRIKFGMQWFQIIGCIYTTSIISF